VEGSGDQTRSGIYLLSLRYVITISYVNLILSGKVKTKYSFNDFINIAFNKNALVVVKRIH